MRTSKTILAFAGLCIALGTGCKRNASATNEAVQPAPQATREADFASAKYTPVPATGSGSFRIETGDANYRGTGAQGVLLETLNISSLDEDPVNASGTGYHFFLYNHSVHPSESGQTKCNLSDLVDGFSVLMFDVNGEGLIKTERIAQEGTSNVGYYPGAGCSFILTGVHSTGTIPDDVWVRAEEMWKTEAKAAKAQATAQPAGDSRAAPETKAADNARATQVVQVTGQVFSVGPENGRPCATRKECWWDLTVETGWNSEWHFLTTSKPNVSENQFVQVVARVSTNKFMTEAEVKEKLPRLMRVRVVDPATDDDAQIAKGHIDEQVSSRGYDFKVLNSQ